MQNVDSNTDLCRAKKVVMRSIGKRDIMMPKRQETMPYKVICKVDLPIAVIVKFESYRGLVFNDSQSLCVPIYPITVTLQTEIGFHERQQLPLRLAWALTIHKSQGLALPKAWIDIGMN